MLEHIYTSFGRNCYFSDPAAYNRCCERIILSDHKCRIQRFGSRTAHYSRKIELVKRTLLDPYPVAITTHSGFARLDAFLVATFAKVKAKKQVTEFIYTGIAVDTQGFTELRSHKYP
jgi:hypothetical protein